MNAYIEDMSRFVWDQLHDGGESFVSDKVLGPVGAAAIAESIDCHCAYRYEKAAYEFAVDVLTQQHPLDLLLIGQSWRHGQ